MKRLFLGCTLLLVCLLHPPAGYGQVERLSNTTTLTTFQSNFSLKEGLDRHYRHRISWPAKATPDTAGIHREWDMRHRFLGSDSRENIEVYVVSVSPQNIQVDTTVSRTDAPDTAGWLYRRPEEHLLIYSLDGRTVYRNVEHSLDWPEQRSEILETWTDRDRLTQRPPWFVRPPYQSTCRMKGRLDGKRCLLASGPVRAADTAWTMSYTDYGRGEGDTGPLRTVRLEFNTGETIIRRFREGEGLVQEITRADWSRSIELGEIRTVDETNRDQSDSANKQPDVPEPASPNDPTELPDANRPPDPNTGNEPPDPDW